MICHNCKSEMPDNMKFCTKCGTSLRYDAAAVQQAPTYQKVQQVPAYNSVPQYTPQIPIEMQLHELQKKNKSLKIWVGILAALTVWFCFSWIWTADVANQTQYKLDTYENRGAFDKTVDALDSWLDIVAPIVDMVK